MIFHLIFRVLLVTEEVTNVSWGGSDPLHLEEWPDRDFLNTQFSGDPSYYKLYLILCCSLSCLLFCSSWRDLHHYLSCNYAPSLM